MPFDELLHNPDNFIFVGDIFAPQQIKGSKRQQVNGIEFFSSLPLKIEELGIE